MNQRLDASEVSAWLTSITQTIDRSLREPARAETLRELRDGVGETKAGLPMMAQLALLDDCLRVAHLAIEADGQIESDELARVAGLVRVAAAKYASVLPTYDGFGDGDLTALDIGRFLRTHRSDHAPFGFENKRDWRGLELVRRVEHVSKNGSPLREHERMLSRIMEEVFGGRASEVERAARRRLRELFEPPLGTGLDPRATAFCRDDGPEVFSSVAHGSHIHERDPFDTESIHAEAREVFHGQVQRAATPYQAQGGHGRTLLVLGESGAGKTHLLRAFRAQVHGQRLGYVGYMQMTSEVGDYSRYVLRSLIDSMERPYDAPVAAESALMYLSDGLVDPQGRAVIPAGELEQLRTAELEPAQLEAVVGKLVDRIVRTEGLDTLEVDLVQALLLLQRRDPALQRRVVRFLRCDGLNSYDRQLLGGLAPRDQPEDPLRTIKQLATIMHELQTVGLILAVDQIEETIPDGVTVTRIQQAFDSLRAIADAVPSAVIVISCLQDVYDAVRPRLSRSLVDRLEHDPMPVRLTSQRAPEEIEQMLIRRLEHLYTAFDVDWREDEPLYPFTPAHIDAVSQLRARDCLAKFRAYHASCIAARGLVDASATAKPVIAVQPSMPATASLPVAATSPAVVVSVPVMPLPPHVPPTISTAQLDRAWGDAVEAVTTAPDDEELLVLVGEAVRGAGQELGFELAIRPDAATGQVVIESATLGRRVLGLCNGRGQGGHLGRQLAELRKYAKGTAIPVALRNGDFQFPQKSVTSVKIGEFIQSGGRTVVLEEQELRVVMAARAFTAAKPAGLAEWRRAQQPLAQLGFVRELLDLDRITPVTVAPSVPPSDEVPADPPKVASAAPMIPPIPARVSGSIAAFDPMKVTLGSTTTMRAEPVRIEVDQLKTHIAFLGGPGSGKTTVALSVIEQLLERGVSALLVDRKGDLARYASDAWWSDPDSPDRARKIALRARIDVSLFTPGNIQGRPLRLPLIPPMTDVTSQERDLLAQYAAEGLAGMLGYGRSRSDKAKTSVLQCAIKLLAGFDVTIESLHETVARPDPELLRNVDSLQRHFASLSEDLQTLRIQRGALLTGAGETLDLDALLPPISSGRPQLSIINTSAIADNNVLQFWISRLLVEIGRLGRRRPSSTLQAVTFFDEADAYIPASSEPPTKGPMFDLLRRARATGIGVLLATQNPGDFDYKARDNIQTWLLGRIREDRAIEKMRNLLGSYPNVGPRLAGQAAGHFFVLETGGAKEVRCDRSLMATEQASESEVAEFARRNKPST